ncbi:hypothetical protein PI124_g16423 [Phytophthora idaei]|nr:hypothetical protein PI125_g16747 [Phytophthora idaei]KAG3238617.1 hypothetical protein PI124_g16423 [Phytophthora idaei]
MSNVAPRFGTTTATDMRFISNNQIRMTIDSAGFVGIGITNPSYLLTLQGSLTTAGAFETLLSMSNADAFPAVCQIQLKTGPAATSECFIGSTSAGTKTVLMVGGARIITCESTGNVAIGSTTSTYKLDASGTINCTNLYRSGVVADLILISGITTIGTGQASKALTLDSARSASNIASLACDTLVANASGILNINPTSLQIRGTTLTATATQLNVLNGYTGTTANLNDLVLLK